MKLLALTAFAFLARTAAGDVHCDRNCPRNEIYTQCAGAGQPSCWNQTSRVTDCSPGCECKPGFVRDPHSFFCIDPRFCPRRPASPRACPAREVYSECGAGCQRTCDSLGAVFKCQCVPGCVCFDGFVRSAITGQCVRVKECKNCPPGYSKNPLTGRCEFCCRECSDNEEFSLCGSYCEPTCQKSDNFCITLCKRGCFCKKGYIRDQNTGQCIPQEWCSKCAPNEVFSCGIPQCEKTCKNLNEKCTIQPIRCEDKCYCQDGFARNAQGVCIPAEKC